ncbi:hypothetical protein [Ideonella sp. YS5]|uniref:hypothetical protein n=1 Tax=Ideonella sp. YS5 TaxID=3453714 RepID=UPI003EE9BB20
MSPLLAALLLLMAAAAAPAAPRAPTDDREVVERLPTRLPGVAPRRMLPASGPGMASAMPSPASLSTALALARRAMEQAHRSGDPRDWGQAQAALAPWWNAAEPPAEVRLLRAMVRQSQHDFAGALSDLDSLVGAPKTADPSAGADSGWARRAAYARHGSPALALRAQAELTRAGIHQVQGRYADARAGCGRLMGDTYAALGETVTTPACACLAELDHLQGRLDARRADATLASLGRGNDPWLSLLRAELAQRSGRHEAERLFLEATAGDAPSLYALAARADWLLEQGRPAEVDELLQTYDAADGLLLRRAIANRQLAARQPARGRVADELARQVQARFDAALARGDMGHAREQSRFALDVRGDAQAALALAEANWVWQREPADALLLLRAADAAGRPDAASPVLAWAREQGFRDARWPARFRMAKVSSNGKEVRT